MKDRLFIKIAALVIAFGIISSSILIGYTIKLHGECSILNFIANERD
ncbi:MAG: hypothetical protein J1F22_06090 [Lachnospiraceae bacterium]|nr:hypothetical protein [Lachnospiraceae bacterium]